jgi:hypothetical protein
LEYETFPLPFFFVPSWILFFLLALASILDHARRSR